MPRFAARPLGVLDNIYKFIGGQTGPRSVWLEGDVYLVHDVSREAEIGTAQSSALGYYLRGANQTHVGTGTLFTDFDNYARDFLNLAPKDVDIWVVDALCNVDDAGDFESAAIGIEYPILPGAFTTQAVKLIRQFTTPAAPLESGGLEPVPPLDDFCRLPMYAPHGSRLFVRSTADNSGTISVITFALMWAGARGTLPPGLA